MKAIYSVLIVDDEQDMRFALGRLLMARGFEVVTASGGAKALQLLETGAPLDLLVLDVRMPGMSGLVLLNRLRHGPYPRIPVLILSAKATPEDVCNGYAQGANLYLTKPFKPPTFIQAVWYLVGDLAPREKEVLELDLLAAEEVHLLEPQAVRGAKDESWSQT
ncbi:MAG: response regulator [Planctomycetota bacterium]|nr:response regulator [Planctomycetota bacterium]